MTVIRAKSQLLTVGSLALWQEQSGLPALLPARSAPLEAGDDGAPAEAGTPDPAAEAREDLADHLQRYLTGRVSLIWSGPCKWAGTWWTCCSPTPARIRRCSTTLDRDPARTPRLRLLHARGDLLTGLPSGGHGAQPCLVSRTVRVPAWRILSGEHALAPLID
ncbi:hypothetical protein [Streptomyces coelicoflavus]|uniref:hypothetical protein n=1 Tax=Streptomyces coelicoflavus TaxID=285562 RepID=UPI001FD0B3F1|nr:hypothetical protein [Streptomyces coelicoflavus]